MSPTDEFLTPEQRWQGTENLKLVRQFLFEEYLEDPARFRQASQPNRWILLPPDTPENQRLTEANLAMAAEAQREGRPFETYVVGSRAKRKAKAS